MSKYNDLSRRGLIRLNNDFDLDNNNALKEYLNQRDGNYEGVRPLEQMMEELDNASEKVKIQGGVVSSAVIKRIDKVFDRMMGKLQNEVERSLAIIDEQLDDTSYPSDMDEDNEEDFFEEEEDEI